MDHVEAHRIARILNGPVYDGELLNNLIDKVQEAEGNTSVDPNAGFYRGKIGIAATQSTSGGSRYEADNCEHCHAAYGHKGFCPLICRETAEAISAFNGQASEADRLAAHALGVKLD